jgi:hypothetical protein
MEINMTHTFDTDIAKEYGVDIAILVNNFAFWLQKNKANKKHIYEGKVWTYNSTKAFSELFPYWTENQIRRILGKMQDLEIIQSGNYNKVAYDRTKWYTFTDAFVEKHKSICEFCQMESADLPNGIGENHEPIPDSKPDVNNTDIKTDIEQSFFDNEELNQIFLDFIADRKKRGKKMTDKAIELTVKKLKGFRSDSSRIKAITESIANGWIGIFEPAEDSPKKKYDRTANSNFDGLKSGEVDF